MDSVHRTDRSDRTDRTDGKWLCNREKEKCILGRADELAIKYVCVLTVHPAVALRRS